MAKDFKEAFDAWVHDDRYAVGDDVGAEYYDYLEAGPTPVDRSLTPDNGTENSTEEIVDRG